MSAVRAASECFFPIVAKLRRGGHVHDFSTVEVNREELGLLEPMLLALEGIPAVDHEEVLADRSRNFDGLLVLVVQAVGDRSDDHYLVASSDLAQRHESLLQGNRAGWFLEAFNAAKRFV